VTVPTSTGDARRFIGIGLAVAVAYVVAARLGFRFAFVAEQITTVWAPTGIAQAALLLWGRSLWPAVWLGALVANAGTEAPLWTAAGVATGNTLEALAATWILHRRPDFDPTLRRTRDAIAFIVVAAFMSTAISASIGVTTLCSASVQPWARFWALWADWWLGDALGALVVARDALPAKGDARIPRAAAVAGAALVVAALVVEVSFVEKNAVHRFYKSERVYPRASEMARRRVPENGIVASMQMSGALHYYTPLTYAMQNWLLPERFGALRSETESRGYRWYALLSPFETEEVRKNLPGDWREIDRAGDVVLWELPPSSPP